VAKAIGETLGDPKAACLFVSGEKTAIVYCPTAGVNYALLSRHRIPNTWNVAETLGREAPHARVMRAGGGDIFVVASGVDIFHARDGGATDLRQRMLDYGGPAVLDYLERLILDSAAPSCAAVIVEVR
jgi:hypothetical protein